MFSNIYSFLLTHEIPAAEQISALLILLVSLGTAICVFFISRTLILPSIGRIAERTPVRWDQILLKFRFFKRLSRLFSAMLFLFLSRHFLPPDTPYLVLPTLITHVYIVYVTATLLFALLNASIVYYESVPFSHQIPLKVFTQVIKIVVVLFALIITASLILQKSPLILLSGLGALTAVLMLVFKDPILGFVAGIQLSANKMLAVGDWLEMSKYSADGTVIDITLTTVKIQNWDNTITTIPTYSLISDSFKNWRGLREIGGRRISRSIFIDLSTIHFLSKDELQQLKSIDLLSPYFSQKLREVHTPTVETPSPENLNERHLTNIGTFRAYLSAYISRHPDIETGLLHMVRQLEPTAQGLAIQIYAFTKDIRWASYEAIQADIFDHVFAAAPLFNLRLYQTPSGEDIRTISR
ncbi:mechanosensitive ion channel family protein [Chitinivibrio alkaliphilus]|uniref:Mechanosensing system component YbdG n=1 Tax=Chitinivibrio alkaliphilus ACht1 TaxID=1313304 RepID=U7DBY5_9BACT|nr:mechanosensitive ion channel domain-containing protein [Chitinivibrio alkaliphilus]ERP39093.1 mechanosensitive ion channel protein [Chitinivibrio alkaliphilus ACht1]